VSPGTGLEDVEKILPPPRDSNSELSVIQPAASEIFRGFLRDCIGTFIPYFRCGKIVKLLRFLLWLYSLVETCNNVQNCIIRDATVFKNSCLRPNSLVCRI
jgi:hypothetical protein